MRLYLGVETYRPEKAGAFTQERVIAIGALLRHPLAITSRCNEFDADYVLFTEWKSGGELNLISEFYEWFTKLVQEFRNVQSDEKLVIIGFNILRFDIPLLIQKGVEYDIGSKYCIKSIAKLNELWHNTHTIDYQQVALPYYNLPGKSKFPSLADLIEAARKTGINVPELYGSGEDVKEWYKNEKYNEIEKRLRTKLNVLCIIDSNFKFILESLYKSFIGSAT